ncbi:hypothetical protein ACT7C1_11580 [Bacillus paranthracis]
MRNGKEDYSFFFSATQANVIEKALKKYSRTKNSCLKQRRSQTSRKKI